ncbi:right-handed parallel beta-helix repeat-containing protein [Clostridium gasigenes]|uniref:right-handed parallel beta-helix repeat-containing protein n=1 Tax=Clostridium gasigenes TaxID=94869 RepID=UPI001C0D5E77|nr:right-handed parallel beta-helix repeat-containing protein [Clostridium gasigenes]MBU3103006.1 right-handed parallel beta-helix repeat-containing protein [Clostridium gasigenes]
MLKQQLINSSKYDAKQNLISSIPFKGLQECLNNTPNNSTITLNNSFVGKKFVLENKNNILITGQCQITQQTDYEEVQTYSNPISEMPLFQIKNCKNIIIIGSSFKSEYEALDIVGCENITFYNIDCDGLLNTSKFNGVVSRDSKDITFYNSKVHNYSVMPTYNSTTKQNNYSIGNGFTAYGTDGFTLINCKSDNNAMNGVYTFACSNVTISENTQVTNNGMSGIQFAFATGNEKKYRVSDVFNAYNYSDGLDINNTTGTIIDIDCVIDNNYYRGNGWFGRDVTKITQDGSGVATLFAVKNVRGKGNICMDSCRSSLFINGCENINIGFTATKSAVGVTPLIYVGNSKHIDLTVKGWFYGTDDNAIAIDTTLGAVENFVLRDSFIYADTTTPLYCKGTGVFSGIKVFNSELVSRTKSIELSKKVEFLNCKLVSILDNGGYMTEEGITLENCEIISLSKFGLTILNGSRLINCNITGSTHGGAINNINNTTLINTKFHGNTGLIIENCVKANITGCEIEGINSTGLQLMNKANVYLTGSKLISKTGNSIRCEAGSTIFEDNNITVGFAEFTTAVVKRLTWS